MKRYIDAELLKREIESLKSLEYPCDNSEQNFGFEYALDRLSDSLNSLQQEQPSEDLKEEIKRYGKEEMPVVLESDLNDIARHFAEWQYQKDRREFAKLKAKEWSDGYNEGIAKGKEQMLKEAVEGEAEELYNDGEIHCTVGVGTYFKPGDEVYVIKKKD